MTTHPEPWPSAADPLGEALHFLELRRAFYCRAEFTAPFGLSDHREALGASGLLLPAIRGERSSPMGHSALVKRLKKRWQAAGLEPLRLHQGRHTYASLLIAAGANAKAITTYMGHSSIQVTFDRYGHLMPGSEAEVAGLLDSYLERSAVRALPH